MRLWPRRNQASDEPVVTPSVEPGADAPSSAPEPFTGELVRLIPAGDPAADDADALTDGAAPVVRRAPGRVEPEVPAPVPVPAERRKPLLIGDDDLVVDAGPLDASEPSLDGSGAVPIDPRLRRRRIDVRRAAGRKRLLVVLAIGSVFAIALAALAVLASPLFSVSEIEVSGNVYTSEAELAPIIADARDHAILTLDTDEIARRLEELPWVRRARVQADFPSTLKIELAERRPVAAYQGTDAQWRVVDRDGRVIAIIADGAQPADYLPIEPVGPEVAPGTLAGDPYRIAGELAQSLPTELRNVTAAITLGDLGTIGLRLTSGTVVDFGQPSDLRTKLSVLITLLREDDPTELAALNLADPFNPGRTRASDSPNSDG